MADTALETATAAPPSRYAGTRVARVEDTRLLTGNGTFVDDVVRPGMLHACFVRSPFARAKVNSIDTSAALALPGVIAVFTAADLNPDVRGRGTRWRAGHARHPRPPLAEDEVKFVGDPVALLIAENRYLAEDAIELVDVDYEPLPAIADFTKAQTSDVLVHAEYANNQAGGMGGARPTRRRSAAPRTSPRPTSINRAMCPCRSRPAAWSSNGRPHQANSRCGRPPRPA